MAFSLFDSAIALLLLMFYLGWSLTRKRDSRFKNDQRLGLVFLTLYSAIAFYLQVSRYSGGDIAHYTNFLAPRFEFIYWHLFYSLFHGVLIGAVVIYIVLAETKSNLYVIALNANLLSKGSFTLKRAIFFYFLFLSPSLCLFSYFIGKDNLSSAILYTLVLLFFQQLAKQSTNYQYLANISCKFLKKDCKRPRCGSNLIRNSSLIFILLIIALCSMRFYYALPLMVLPYIWFLDNKFFGVIINKLRISYRFFYSLFFGCAVFLFIFATTDFYSRIIYYFSNISNLNSVNSSIDSSLVLEPFAGPLFLLQPLRPILLVDQGLDVYTLASLEFLFVLLLILIACLHGLKKALALKVVLILVSMYVICSLPVAFNSNVADNYRKLSSLYSVLLAPMIYYAQFCLRAGLVFASRGSCDFKQQ